MKFFIHYRPDSGEIFGWGHGFDPAPVEGAAVALLDPFDPDPLTQKYDVGAGRVVDKSDEEKRLSRWPTWREVQCAVFAELCRTDRFMLADQPIDDTEYQAWKGYRQMLRDLSKHADPADMIDAWELPPDAVDPIIALRERLQP